MNFKKMIIYAFSISTLLIMNGCDSTTVKKENEKPIEEKKDITYQKFENISPTVTKSILDSIAIGETKEIPDVKNASVIVNADNIKTYAFLIPYDFSGEAKKTDFAKGKHYTELTVNDYNAFIDILVSEEVNTRKLLIKRIEESRYFIQYLVPEKDEKPLAYTQTTKYDKEIPGGYLRHPKTEHYAINKYTLI
ncbi:hypothetical protein [Bacillus sp. NPDC094106]|uniref:hypothetical protein n=1 Tax=Bacillus sp. NPDC094106 TaxID=3363949 RepID=UPI003802C45C